MLKNGNPDASVVSFDKRALKLDNAENARDIINAISEHTNSLRTLILSGNTMGIEAGEAIGEALASHPELTRALWSDMFTGRSKDIIAPALKNLTKGVILSGAKLVELDLRDNAFGPTGVVGVTDLLGSPCCHTLKVLRLDNEGLGHQGCHLVTEALSKGLRESRRSGPRLQLETFTAGRNRLENEGVKMLSAVFGEMKSLQQLELYQNGIGIHGIEGCEALAHALSENRDLRRLNLSDNSLTAQGIRVIANIALPNLENLEILNLNDCLLKSKGAKILASALNDSTPMLQELHVSGNEIRPNAAIELILSLESKQDILRVLDLNTNELGETGVADIQETAASIDLGHCLQSLSDDEGGDDNDEEEEEEEEDSDEDYSRNEEDEEGEVDSLEGERSRESTGDGIAGFSFKACEPTTAGKKSLFEGLSLNSPGGLFSNPSAAGTPNRSGPGLFGSPAAPKPAGAPLFGSGFASAGSSSLFGDLKPKPAPAAGPGPSSLFGAPKPQETPTSGGLFGAPKPRETATGAGGSPKSQGVLFGPGAGAGPGDILFGRPKGDALFGAGPGSGRLFGTTPRPGESAGAQPGAASVFKTPERPGGPSPALFSSPAASAAAATPATSAPVAPGAPGAPVAEPKAVSGNGSVSVIQPARLAGPATSGTAGGDAEKELGAFLQKSQPLSDDAIRRLAALPNAAEAVAALLRADAALVGPALRRAVEVAAPGPGLGLSRSLLAGALSARPAPALDAVLVELGLIKAEERGRGDPPPSRARAVLALLREAAEAGRVPPRQAQLLSTFLTHGPQRPAAERLRREGRPEVDGLVESLRRMTV